MRKEVAKKRIRERSETIYWLNKIYEVCSAYRIRARYRRLSGCVGFMYLPDEVGRAEVIDIEIDPRYDILGTLVHECLHIYFDIYKAFLYRRWGEKKIERFVRNKEKIIVEHLTPAEAETLTKMLTKFLSE